jgi:HIRAN domain
MMWLAIVALATLVVVILGAAKAGGDSATSHQGRSSAHSGDESEGKTFLPPIPKGFQIYQSRLNPAGIKFHKEAAFDFAMRAIGADAQLSLVRETDNPHDKNAIAVHGVINGQEWTLGYLPKELAREIVNSGIFEEVKPRLDRVWVQSPSSGSKSYVEVNFQLLAPKATVKGQREAQENKPATAEQRRFFRFFGLPIRKGLTVREAAQKISEHENALRAANDIALEDWEGLETIENDFEDKDFRETYDIKSLPNALLKQALDALQAEGRTLRHLAANEDEIVDKLLEMKPDLARQI